MRLQTMSEHMLLYGLLLLLLLIGSLYFFLRYRPKKRFRKRDKLMFYGRQFVRRLRKIKRKQLKRLTQISKPPILWTGKPGNETGTDLPSRGFKTVAIFPNSIEVPVCSFARELHHNLVNYNVLYLTSEKVKAQLGREGYQDEQELEAWLNQQENSHRIVLYQCDLGLTEWTRVCLNRAKCILVVALAQSEPHITYYEQQLYSQSPVASIELVLLHKLDAKKPKHTNIWLSIRSWCPIHHIRCPQRVFVRKRCKIEEVYSKLARTCPSADNDFSRLARYLSGNSIGLVLGGGGARGAAHLGIIKALHEANIPIDMIGGVSIGAFMGALWAQETDLTTVTQLARDWSIKMTSRLRQIVDLTYPITAMFTGAAFNRTIHEAFGDRQIEDLWIPYFTVTTDITSSAPRIHRHGSLWRYVRSSMSLSGYLPPLCDPIDGHLLLDGGYVNNLPADVMHDVMGAKTILAIDVGSQDETDLTDYGDTLNGWWLLWKRWNPFCEPIKVPSLPEIQSRLAYVSCVRQLEEVKKKDYCSYIRPPIDPYKTMQFYAFDRILEIGYEHGRLMFPDEKALTQ